MEATHMSYGVVPMEAEGFEFQGAPCLRQPLCRRYAAVVFSEALSRVVFADGAQEHAVLWALGCVLDGQCELLGAWMSNGTSPAHLASAIADLQVRGVESVRILIGRDLASGENELPVQSCGATRFLSREQTLAVVVANATARNRDQVSCAVRATTAAGGSETVAAAMPSLERGICGERYTLIAARRSDALAIWAPLLKMPARLRRAVLRCDRRAGELHGSLVRAIGRRGGFASQTAALAFVADALLRGERRQSVRRAVAATASRHYRMGARDQRAVAGTTGTSVPGLRNAK